MRALFDSLHLIERRGQPLRSAVTRVARLRVLRPLRRESDNFRLRPFPAPFFANRPVVRFFQDWKPMRQLQTRVEIQPRPAAQNSRQRT
eukprot:936223-Pyramimonas_sp.AAC.1